jgi:hypothetical protein
LGRFERLLNKAFNSPQNLRFEEFCALIRYFDAKERKQRGSHRIFKRHEQPRFTQSVQNVDGMAKPYQIKQFIDKMLNLGLLKEEDL